MDQMVNRDTMVLNRLRNRARGWRALEAEIEAADLWADNLVLRQDNEALRQQAAAKPERAKPEGKPVLGQTAEGPAEPVEPEGEPGDS